MKCCIACRYDYFGNSTYEISPESTEDVLENQINVIKGLTEAPNQSSEDIDISDFSPTNKGKPRTYPTTLFTLKSMFIYLYYALSLEVEMKP
jgi:RNA processing factor Prp31